MTGDGRSLGVLLMALCALVWGFSPLQAHGAVVAWGLMLIGSMILAGSFRSWRSPGDVEANRAFTSWILMTLTACLIDLAMGVWHGEGLRTMRQDGKLFLAAACMMVWWRVLQREGLPVWSRDWWSHAWTAALVLQMLVAAFVALTWPRAALPIGPLPWATAVALGVALLAPMLMSPGKRWPAWILAVALVAGVAAVLGSRSRSAWIVLPWLMVLVVARSRHRLRATALVVGGAALGIAAVLHHDAQQPVQVERGLRLLDLLDELQALGHPDAGTSIGSRLLLWQAAWNNLLEHPLSGVGQAARIALVQTVVPPHQLPDVEPLVHVHQQFLNQAVDHGLPGLLAALLSAFSLMAMAWCLPAGVMRWQVGGVAVVHLGGLMFNANMTHGPYACAVAMAMCAVVMMHAGQPKERERAST